MIIDFELFKEMYNNFDTGNGPDITTWSGDNTGDLGSRGGMGGGRIGGEMDSVGDVSAHGSKTGQFRPIRLRNRKRRDKKRQRRVNLLNDIDAKIHTKKLE